MVRVTRFSFDDGMRIDSPIPRESFDDDELDEFIGEEDPEAPSAPRGRGRRANPTDRKRDRRHLAGADWTISPDKPAGEDRDFPGESRGESQKKTGADL